MAVDPGGTTGIAALEEDGSFNSWEVDDWRVAVRAFVQSAGLGLVDELVIERYTITPQTVKKTAQYDALYCIGALTYSAWVFGTPVVLQQPSVAKGLATNERLEQLGWRRPTRGGHADDAARHLLVRCLSRGLIQPEDVEPSSRFERRKQRRLKDPDVKAGYEEGAP